MSEMATWHKWLQGIFATLLACGGVWVVVTMLKLHGLSGLARLAVLVLLPISLLVAMMCLRYLYRLRGKSISESKAADTRWTNPKTLMYLFIATACTTVATGYTVHATHIGVIRWNNVILCWSCAVFYWWEALRSRRFEDGR